MKIFLQETLKLEMSDTKTKVTHTGDRARFLGSDVFLSGGYCGEDEFISKEAVKRNRIGMYSMI